MTHCYLETLPGQIIVPFVLAVYTNNGADMDPRRYIVAKSPEGERVGLLEFAWHWPDEPESPVKFRVFVHHLPIWIESAGLYEVGLADSPESAQLDSAFPLPVHLWKPTTADSQ
ncbi:hypothetical protein [Mycobacterium sp. ENV421]|uniref:hypothetical protein n=1 Tax=Mycobacterium sp. ENV421 TaxID=1213407 RepID=UPI001E5167A6|nr:hypothetical protein [Mycobacterium sp. ENV421]